MKSYVVKLLSVCFVQGSTSDADWREKNRRAAQIAAEIEGSLTSQKQLAVELENGDEEEAFSAVSRERRGGREGEARGADKDNWREDGRRGGGRTDFQPWYQPTTSS